MSMQYSTTLPSPSDAPANSIHDREPSASVYSFSYGPIRPVRANPSICASLIATYSGGVIVRQVSARASTVSRVYPVMLRNASLASISVPVAASNVMTPTPSTLTIRRRRCSLARSAASARTRAVVSVTTLCTPRTAPSSPRTGEKA
jgi:hypothetical protein